MSIQSTAIDLARGDVGYIEGPKRNQNKFAARTFPSINFQPWCGVFVGDVYKRAGFDIGAHVAVWSTQTLEAWARRKGFWATDHAEVGDLVIYGFGASHAEHVGIAYPDPASAGYRAIEGNTSSGSAGSQRNGGQVAVRYRGRASIRGWVRMSAVLAAYAATGAREVAEAGVAAAEGALTVDGIIGAASAKEIQERLKHHTPALAVDGRIGPATLRTWQEHEGTPADGVLSGQSASAPSALPAFRRDVIAGGGGGSRFVRTLQTNLNGYGYGLTVDGLMGHDTAAALQRAMNEHREALL